MNRICWERENRRLSVLFLVDRDNLEQQGEEKLASALSALKVNTIDHDGRIDVLVAQIATMQNRYGDMSPHHFDLVIVDEAHRSVHGGVWRRVVEHFDCPQIGLTATPPRFNDDETIAYFGEPVFVYSYEDGVRDGILARSVIHRVKTNIDRDGLVVGDRLYRSEDFGVLVQVDNRDWAIVRYYEKNFYGRKCLVFAAGTRHVASLWDKFNRMFASRSDGLSAQFIVSSVETTSARRAVVRQFQDPASNVQVLINLNILTAGFDYPELDLLFFCRYTRHKSLYLQMKGRGARIPMDEQGRVCTDAEGKPIKDRFTSVDFVGVTEWENRTFVPHIPDAEGESADRVLNEDPEEKDVPSVNVEVGIAEVQIIDPFESMENPLLRNLRERLSTANEALQEEREAYSKQSAELSSLHTLLAAKEQEALLAKRDAFVRPVLALKAFAPFAPLTEAVLRQVNPALASLEELNGLFGAQRDSIQEHIDAVLSTGGKG